MRKSHIFWSNNYDYLEARLAKAVDFLKQPGREKLMAGSTVEIEGSTIFARVNSYLTRPQQDCRFEAHDRYVDVQCVVRGEEAIGFAPRRSLEPDGEYDQENDVAFYLNPDRCDWNILRPGDFAVYYPEDGHKPGCMTVSPVEVLKIVVKVAV